MPKPHLVHFKPGRFPVTGMYPDIAEDTVFRVAVHVITGADHRGPIKKPGYIILLDAGDKRAVYPYVWDADRFEVVV